MGPEIQNCDWWTQKKGPMPDLDSFPLVPKGPIVSQTLIQLNTRVGLQTSSHSASGIFVLFLKRDRERQEPCMRGMRSERSEPLRALEESQQLYKDENHSKGHSWQSNACSKL